MKIIIIAAISNNGVIGRDNTIPWYYPTDIKHFRETTSGHSVLASRKTYESFYVQPLPHRFNIILTRDTEYKTDGAEVCHDIMEAIHLARAYGSGKLFILGGAEIYNLVLPLIADEMILTRIPVEIENGDTYFPEWDKEEWEMIDKETNGDIIIDTYRRRV